MSWWMDAGVRPMVPGVYRVKLPYAPYTAWARWDSERWYCWATDKAVAEIVTFSGPRTGYDWRAT